jgi:hypothetical protein
VKSTNNDKVRKGKSYKPDDPVFECELAKSILGMLVVEKVLTPYEADKVHELNKKSFGVVDGEEE